MPLYNALVPTRYSAPLISYLQESDSTLLTQLEAMTGLDSALLCAPDGVMTIEEFDLLMQVLKQITGRTDLSFELGLRITLASHGALGKAMSSCRTVGEVISLGTRFTRLMSPCIALRYRPVARGFELICQPAAGMSTLALHAFFEIHIVSLHRLLHSLLDNRLIAFETWIPMQRPAHVSRYGSLARMTAHFGVGDLPEVRTFIPADLAAAPLAVDATATRSEISELQQLQKSFTPARHWRSWVELILRECENCQPSQTELAEMLNVSAHTLARHLRHEGCSFRQLSSEIRHERALTMLRQGNYPIEKIASRLGYEHVSNFSHAFHKIAGLAPSRYNLP